MRRVRSSKLPSLVALLGAMLFRCEALTPRVAPIQSARVVQSESFRQYFRVDNVVQAERVFRTVLGPQNYGALTAEEWVPYVESLMAGEIEARGTGTFVISLMPQNHELYFFEGWGRYNVVNTRSRHPLVSGEFQIIDDGPRSIRAFDSGAVDVRIRQTLTRHLSPERDAFVHESVLIIRMHVVRIDADLYILDYGAWHEIGLESEHGVELVGCIEFDHRDDGRKLIDLRGRNLLRDDYGKRLAAANFEAAADRHSGTKAPLGSCGRVGSKLHTR